MLIFLSDALFSKTLITGRENRINRAIENILRSAWEGKHIVHASYESLEKLRDYDLSSDCKSVVLNIFNNYSFLDYSKIKHFVEVVPDEDSLELIEFDDGKKFVLSIDNFQNSDLLQETRILCEHLNDADLFRIICEYFIRKENIGNVSLRYEPELGGGSTICDCFEKHIVAKNKFCLAFCDNDKRHPNSAIGGTLQNLNSIERNGNIYCDIVEIDSHEIENLVPFNYLSDIKTNNHQQNGITFIESIKDSPSGELLKYFDIKKGINKKQVSSCQDYYAYAEQLIPYCNTVESMEEINDKVDGFSVIPPVGRIVNDFIDNSDLLNTKAPDFLDFQVVEWNKIGSSFLYWTCSRNQEALNI